MLIFYYLCCRVGCPRVCWTLRCPSPKLSSSTASESWRPSTKARASFKTAVRQLKRIMGNVIIFMAFICIYNLQFIQLGQPSVNPPDLCLKWGGLQTLYLELHTRSREEEMFQISNIIECSWDKRMLKCVTSTRRKTSPISAYAVKDHFN